jgi:hypothetical protein
MTIAAPTTFPVQWNNPDNTPPAPPPYNHRVGAAYHDGYLLFAIPRTAGPLDSATPVLTPPATYYLDLQYNEVETTAAPGLGLVVSAVSPGVTYGIRPNTLAITARMLARMETFAPGGLPWVIWAETPLTPTLPGQTDFYYTIPTVPPPASFPNLPINPIPAFENAPVGGIVDFTTASLDGKVFLLWVNPADPGNIWYSTFDGSVTTPAAILLSVGEPFEIFSIDATAVALLDADNNPFSSIAVVALTTDTSTDIAPVLYGALVNPLTGDAPRVLSMPPSVDGTTPNSSIRCAWGSLPTADGTSPVANGLIVFYGNAGKEHYYIGETENDLGFDGGVTQLSVIDLSTQNAQSPTWTQITPTFTDPAFTMASMVALFPITLFDSSTGNALMSLGIAGALMTTRATGSRPLIQEFGVYDFYVQTVPSLKLIQQPMTSGTTVPAEISDPGTLTAIVSSWVLVGIITGLPPHADGQSGVSVGYGMNKTISKSTTLTSGYTATFNGTVVAASLGVAIDTAKAATTDNTTEIDAMVNFSSDSGRADLEAHGWFLVLQPTYSRLSFVVQNVAGAASGPVITVLTISQGTSGSLSSPNSSGPTLTPIEFNLAAPEQPADPDDAVLPIICQFPAGSDGTVVSWPASNDIAGWMALPYNDDAYQQWLQAWNAMPLPQQPNIISVGDNGYNQCLTFENTTENQFKHTLTIKTGPTINLEVLQFNGSDGLTLDTCIDTSFETSQQLTVSYGPLAGNKAQLQIQPLLLQPASPGAPWLPTLMSQQKPWMLTWRVLTYA